MSCSPTGTFSGAEGESTQGLRASGPQTSSSSFTRMEPPLDDQPGEQDTHFVEPTTQTASPAMSDVKLTRCITPADRMEEENWYILVVTASIRQLNLGTADDDLRELVTASSGRDAYWNLKKGHQWPQAGGLDSGAHHRRHHGPHGVN